MCQTSGKFLIRWIGIFFSALWKKKISKTFHQWVQQSVSSNVFHIEYWIFGRVYQGIATEVSTFHFLWISNFIDEQKKFSFSILYLQMCYSLTGVISNQTLEFCLELSILKATWLSLNSSKSLCFSTMFRSTVNTIQFRWDFMNSFSQAGQLQIIKAGLWYSRALFPFHHLWFLAGWIWRATLSLSSIRNLDSSSVYYQSWCLTKPNPVSLWSLWVHNSL